jgi:uncharacterized membrane protein
MQKIKKLIPVGLMLAPAITFAITAEELISHIASILSDVVLLLVAFAVVVFLWGVVKYIMSGDNEEKRKEARQYITWGIVGLFVMVSVWGLVNILIDTLGIETGSRGFDQLRDMIPTF